MSRTLISNKGGMRSSQKVGTNRQAAHAAWRSTLLPQPQHGGASQVTGKRDRRDAAREEARAEVRAGRGGATARAKATAVFVDDAALAPVLDNSLGWGAFMATSANVRYQLINAFEERFLVRSQAMVPTF